ncbi:uncharacterized protein LOC119331548 isoform X2 [Triticum dicoccoides]|uniref:uncharacterized protein LOC119331548 isoform X2 n=1 Tax=Triticum dicoccoides TaxID=85692 RepID=UPI00188F6EE5|nr:uncharacterized protein LOC119331548 isoform X2 [Triticum dicoccoides]
MDSGIARNTQIFDCITECSRVGAAAELRMVSPATTIVIGLHSLVKRASVLDMQAATAHQREGKSKTMVMIFAKEWKTMLTKATFVGHGFTRKPVEYEKLKLKAMHGIVQFEVYLTCADLRMKGRRQNLANELNKIKSASVMLGPAAKQPHFCCCDLVHPMHFSSW